MTEQELTKTYDMMLDALVTNIYTISKYSKCVVLKGFNPNKIEHLVILYCANTLTTFINKPIAIDMPLFSYIKFLFSKNRRRIKVKRAKISYEINMKTCSDLYKDLEKVYHCSFKDIYNMYYGGDK